MTATSASNLATLRIAVAAGQACGWQTKESDVLLAILQDIPCPQLGSPNARLTSRCEVCGTTVFRESTSTVQFTAPHDPLIATAHRNLRDFRSRTLTALGFP